MKRGYLLIACMALGGCAGMSEAMKYNQTVHHVKMDDDTYRVFEYPDGSKIMTTPSMGRSAAAGAVQGATLGLVSAVPPEQRHEAAARKYLNETGRTHCKIVSGYLLIKPQYEFKLDCSAPPEAEKAGAIPPAPIQ